MTTTETFATHSGERVLRENGSCGVIVHRWFGLKTAKSSKPTWNESVLAKGPVAWVRAEWRKAKTSFGATA